MTNKNILQCLIVGALILVSAACVPQQTRMREIVADKHGYLEKEFSTQKISGDVSGKLPPATATPSPAKEIRIKFSSVYARSDKETMMPTINATYVGLGNGYSQQLLEFSNNDVPYLLDYSLLYSGAFPLKSQKVRMRYTHAEAAVMTKKIGKLSPFSKKPDENSEYTIEYTSEPDRQGAVSQKSSITCRSQKSYPANKLHAKFSGNALDMICEHLNDGVLRMKRKYAFLHEYGVAILLEDQGSSFKLTNTIVDASVVR